MPRPQGFLDVRRRDVLNPLPVSFEFACPTGKPNLVLNKNGVFAQPHLVRDAIQPVCNWNYAVPSFQDAVSTLL